MVCIIGKILYCDREIKKSDIYQLLDENNMEYKLLNKKQISRFMELDRREVTEYFYILKNKELVLIEEHFEVPNWSENVKKEFIERITTLFERGGLVYGAFEDDKLVGMSTLDTRFLGENDELLNLNGLWVSRDYRKKGVGRNLVQLITTEAKKRNAKGLYVSATNTKNTVDFYMGIGFKLTDKVDKQLFELEPEDIHMVMYF